MISTKEALYLTTLAREHHFGRAAKACHISQPSLSTAIQKLEQRLGVTLFERNRNDILITEIGKQILVPAQQMLDEAKKINQLIQSNSSQLEEPLRLGAIFTTAPYLFPNLVSALKKSSPNMPLYLQEDFTENLRPKLNSGELDAIIVACPFSEPNTVAHYLFDEPFVVLLPKTHPLAKQKSIAKKDLKKESLLLLGQGHCFRDQIVEHLPFLSGSELAQTVSGTSLETLRHMVASGLGITILPASAAQHNAYPDLLVTRPLADNKLSRTMALVWRTSFPRPKAIDALIKALKKSKLKGICPL